MSSSHVNAVKARSYLLIWMWSSGERIFCAVISALLDGPVCYEEMMYIGSF